MEYRQLSKETLIHEIRQLSKLVETYKMNETLGEMANAHFFDSMNTPVILIDHNYEIVWANEFLLTKQSKVINQKCYKVLYDLDDLCPHCPRENVINSSKSDTTRMTVNHFDIENHWEMAIYPLEGHFSEFTLEIPRLINKSVDENQQLKEEIEALKKDIIKIKEEKELERKFLEKLIFELKIPLNALKGFPSYFDENVLSTSDKEYLDLVAVSTNYMTDIYDNFKKYIRSYDNRYKFVVEEFSIEDEIENIIQAYEVSNHKRGELFFDFYKTTPKTVKGNKTMFIAIIEMILELVGRYNRQHPIEISVYHIVSNEQMTQYKFAFVDNGEGIPKYLIDLLTLPFNQELFDISIDDYNEFLDILTFKKMIESINGELFIRSIKGKGTEIELILPFKRVSSLKNKISHEKVDLELKKERKIIVILDSYRRILPLEMYANYRVIYCKLGKEVVDVFENEPVEIVFINVMTDDINGFELYDRLKEIALIETVYVAMSHKILKSESQFLMSYGFDYYLEKPYEAIDIEKIATYFIEESK